MWLYLGLEADERNIQKQELKDEHVCRTCYKRICEKMAILQILLSHLHDNHPEEYIEAFKFAQKSESSIQLSLLDTIQKGSMYSAKSPRARELNRALGYVLAKDM